MKELAGHLRTAYLRPLINTNLVGGFDCDHFEVLVFDVDHIGFIRTGVELALLRRLGLDPEVDIDALLI